MNLQERLSAIVTNSNFTKGDLNFIQNSNEILEDLKIAPGIEIGDPAPLFCVKNAEGKEICLEDLLAKGPVVISFYRGDWCPFCRAELIALQEVLKEIESSGGSLLAVGPQSQEQSYMLSKELGLSFEMLSDPDQKLIQRYKLQFEIPANVKSFYLEKLKLDLSEQNADGSWNLPVPATFILDSNGIVCGRYVSTNYMSRMEPQAVTQSVYNLSSSKHELLSELRSKNEILTNTLEELKRTQEQMLRQEKKAAVGNLAAGLFHEIKNLLNPISILTLVEGELSDKSRQKVQLVYDARDRLLDLVNEIRGLSMDEEVQYSKSSQSLEELIEHSIFLARMDPDVFPKKIVTDYSYNGEIMVNKNKIIQVMLNLIRNAAHAIEHKKDGQIRIQSEENNSHVNIHIIDNGHGIEEDKLNKIWDAFFSTKGEQGTGLGLDISKNIIESHGGTITCQSKIDEGTTFSFSLPRA